jgi:hypothetical protein
MFACLILQVIGELISRYSPSPALRGKEASIRDAIQEMSWNGILPLGVLPRMLDPHGHTEVCSLAFRSRIPNPTAIKVAD